jgi:hypothetical protein
MIILFSSDGNIRAFHCYIGTDEVLDPLNEKALTEIE